MSTNDPGVKSDLFGELVDKAPESKTTGKLSESKMKLCFVFNVDAKMDSWLIYNFHFFLDSFVTFYNFHQFLEVIVSEMSKGIKHH